VPLPDTERFRLVGRATGAIRLSLQRQRADSQDAAVKSLGLTVCAAFLAVGCGAGSSAPAAPRSSGPPALHVRWLGWAVVSGPVDSAAIEAARGCARPVAGGPLARTHHTLAFRFRATRPRSETVSRCLADNTPGVTSAGVSLLDCPPLSSGMPMSSPRGTTERHFLGSHGLPKQFRSECSG
jgi:hypothetical protein